MSKGPAYLIRTPRLVLRCWAPSDAPRLHEAVAASLDHIRKWLPWAKDEPITLQQRTQNLRKYRAWFDSDQDYVYAIFDPTEATVLGGTGFHRRVGEGAIEIGYWIAASSVRQGLCSEAVAALTQVAFHVHGFERVEIHCDPRNTASAGVARKLGYVHDATLRMRKHGIGGVLRDSMVWSMLASELPASPAARVSYEAFDVLGDRIST